MQETKDIFKVNNYLRRDTVACSYVIKVLTVADETFSGKVIKSNHGMRVGKVFQWLPKNDSWKLVNYYNSPLWKVMNEGQE